MYTKYHFRMLATPLAVCVLLATGSDLAAASLPAPNITEPRNAAAGFAITSWMVAVDALGVHCSKLSGPSDAQVTKTLKTWQGRNAPYVNAALEYMTKIEEFIQAEKGEAARAAFRADRTVEFVTSSKRAEAVWFADAHLDEASCTRMAGHYADGSLDLDKSSEFFPILKALKGEADADAKGAE